VREKLLMVSQEALTESSLGRVAGKRSRWVALASLAFVLLQSVCTAVIAVSGFRLVLGLGSLAAAAWLPQAAIWLHADAIRIPMIIVAVLGSVINLYVVWRIRSLRARPSSRWRAQPVTQKETRSELIQIALAVLTLLLIVAEVYTHHIIHP